MLVFSARISNLQLQSFISRDENKAYYLVYGGVIALLLSSCRQPSMIKWVQGALSFSDRQKELWCLVATNAYISSLFWRDVISEHSIKFTYSEKASKIWPILHSFFDIKYVVPSDYQCNMGQIFVAFLEYLNFADFCFKF